MPDTTPFIWHEPVTPDQASSGNFFSQLFRWTRREVACRQFDLYCMVHNIEKLAINGWRQ